MYNSTQNERISLKKALKTPWRLCSTPLCNALPPTCRHRNEIRCAYLSWADAPKTLFSVQQEVGHFDVWQHFSQIHASFESHLLLELHHQSLNIHSASSSWLGDEKLCKCFSYVIPGGRDGVIQFYPSPWSIKSSYLQHTISHLHQTSHAYRGCCPEYVNASVLSRPFRLWLPFWNISNPRTVMTSSYRFNTTDFMVSQYHPRTLKMKTC